MCIRDSDKENRWIKRTRGNGRVTEREMMCCGPLWEKDDDGIMTTYSYNTARQLVEVSRSEVTDGETIVTPETIVSYTPDAFGRILQTRRAVSYTHLFAKIRLLRLYSRESASAKLFPLNGSRGLGGNVVKDAVDALYFICLLYTSRCV